MPRASRPWFRLYVEAVSDPKLRRVSPAQRWLWISILAAARQSPISGWLMISEDEPMSNADLADLAGVPMREVAKTLPVFEKAGMLLWDSKILAWQVRNWDVRQFESDNVTERTRKHRSNDTGRNVPTSFPGTPVDSPRNGGRNNVGVFLGTPPESETDLKSSSSQSLTKEASGEPVDDDDEESWKPGTVDIDEALDVLVTRRLAVTKTQVSNVGGWRAVTKKGMWTEFAELIDSATAMCFRSHEDLANYLEPVHNPMSRSGQAVVPAQVAAQHTAAQSDLEPCPKCQARGGLGWVPAPDGNGVMRCPDCTPQHAQAAS